jgi:hypothetical protein
MSVIKSQYSLSNVSCTTNVHTLYNNVDVEIIFFSFLFLCRKHYSFFIVKIISTSTFLYKVCTFVVQEILLILIKKIKKLPPI